MLFLAILLAGLVSAQTSDVNCAEDKEAACCDPQSGLETLAGAASGCLTGKKIHQRGGNTLTNQVYPQHAAWINCTTVAMA